VQNHVLIACSSTRTVTLGRPKRAGLRGGELQRKLQPALPVVPGFRSLPPMLRWRRALVLTGFRLGELLAFPLPLRSRTCQLPRGRAATRAARMLTIRAFTKTLVPFVVVLLVAACHTSRRDQLEAIAKDWCETIRASQVIAVYPLTQDLQPGDVFLVQKTIDKQQEQYRQGGFLPLDNHLARLHPLGYRAFYEHSFLDAGSDPALPKGWLKGAWQTAPAAAFPSYAFSATQAGGLSLAIPVSGVPVGLSLLGTQAANGTISLRDARTVGVDTASLYRELCDWARELPNQRLLAPFGAKAGTKPANFLRIVTRVYLLGEIDVQLNDARSSGGGLDAGVARPIELFLPETPQGTGDVRRAGQETYLRGVQRLNAMSGTGVALSSEGADPSLSSQQFDTRQRARDAERKLELEQAAKEKVDADKALADARQAATESPEGKALEQAGNELGDSLKFRDQKAEALRTAEAAVPPDPARIDAAAKELGAAEKAVATGQRALREKQTAFREKHDAALQGAAAKLEIKQAALERVQGIAPGASVRFTAASARSISMSEKFKVPLVVGYLGFDVPIGAGGHLGVPIPTYAVLNDRNIVVPPVTSTAFAIYRTAARQNLYDALVALAKQDADAARQLMEINARIARFVPERWRQFRILPSGDRELSYQDRSDRPADLGIYMIYDKDRTDAVRALLDAEAKKQSVSVEGKAVTGNALRDLAEKLAATEREQAAFAAAIEMLWAGFDSF
jgi:hypothetical protein